MTDRITLSLTLVLGGLVAGGALFIQPEHTEFPWHHVPGHMAAIGFVGCIVVVRLSKWLGTLFLQRPESGETSGGRR